MKIITLFAFIFLGVVSLAMASDNDTYIYAPEHCGFQVTLPSEPHIVRVCGKGSEQKCYDRVQYTHVFSLDESVRVEIICNAAGADIYDAYSPEVMQATLRAMTNQERVQQIEMTAREDENYKMASLIGEGQQGQHSSLYIAQLWIGKSSTLSVELESIGVSSTEGDVLLRDILQSIQIKASKDSANEEEADKTGDQAAE